MGGAGCLSNCAPKPGGPTPAPPAALRPQVPPRPRPLHDPPGEPRNKRTGHDRVWWVHTEAGAPRADAGSPVSVASPARPPHFRLPAGRQNGGRGPVPTGTAPAPNSGRTTAPIGLRARIRVVASLTRPPPAAPKLLIQGSESKRGLRTPARVGRPATPWTTHRWTAAQRPHAGHVVGGELHPPEGAARASRHFRVR